MQEMTDLTSALFGTVHENDTAKLTLILRTLIEMQKAQEGLQKLGIKDLVPISNILNAKNMFGTPLLVVASTKGRDQIASILIDHGADVEATNKKGETSLHVASLQGNQKMVALLLDAGADANKARTNNGETPLHAASSIVTPRI